MFATEIFAVSPFAGGADHSQSGGASGPVIIDVTAYRNSIVLTYSGTATEYRINGGTPAAIGVSPATITGLTANTEYNTPGVEIRNGSGDWSSPVAFGTTNSASGDDEILPSYVQSDLPIAWEVLSAATGDLPVEWQVIGQAQSDVALSWQVQGSASVDLALGYAVLMSAISDLVVAWQIEATSGAASSDLNLSWGIGGAAQSDLGLSWGIYSPVSVDLAIGYAIQSPVTADLVVAWTIDGGIVSDLPLSWDVTGSVMRDLGLTWAIQDTAATEEWPITVTLTPVHVIKPALIVNRPTGLNLSITPQ